MSLTGYEYIPAVDTNTHNKMVKYRRKKNSSYLNFANNGDKTKEFANGINKLVKSKSRKGYISKKDLSKFRSSSMGSIDYNKEKHKASVKKKKKNTAAFERRKFSSNLEVDLRLTPVNKEIPIFDQKSKHFSSFD